MAQSAIAMSWNCLLCGYFGEEESASANLPCCSWCHQEALELRPEEVSAILKLDTIQPRFKIWSQGRREASPEEIAGKASDACPEPQPAKIFPGLPLYIGDMDDAADVKQLKLLRIGCVVNLCANKIRSGYQYVPMDLAEAGIHQHILVADDSRHCDIIQVAEHAIGAVNATLTAPYGNTGVLIHCWGGVNRSAAVAIVILTTQYAVPLFAAVEQVMKKRGTILTNASFRKQLVRHCFKKGLYLEGSHVPASLLVASTTDHTTSGECEH